MSKNNHAFDLTPEEKSAIRTLRALEKKWPPSLWLFSASGTLCVMRCKDGEHAMKPLDNSNNGGGVDPDFIVNTINIPNDGGDW